jgi:hypothetical protein
MKPNVSHFDTKRFSAPLNGRPRKGATMARRCGPLVETKNALCFLRATRRTLMMRDCRLRAAEHVHNLSSARRGDKA